MNPKTKECTLDTLRPDHRRQIASQLPRDETPLICCVTEYVGFLREEASYAYVITSRRVIATRLMRGEKEISVSSIFFTDIVTSGEYDYEGTHGIDIQGHGGSRMRYYFESNEVLVKFRNILQDAMNRAKQTPSQSQTTQPQRNPADRLRELVQLHQDGFITDAEFEQKRKEILGRL
jgi:hypothetical protein